MIVKARPRNRLPVEKTAANSAGFLRRCGRDGLDNYGIRRLRPLARRRASTRRPPTVAMRARKPCVRLRRRTFGWYVRFMTGKPLQVCSKKGREFIRQSPSTASLLFAVDNCVGYR